MIPNARTLLERRELLGQLGIHFQLADFPQRLVWAGAADGERDLSRRQIAAEGKAKRRAGLLQPRRSRPRHRGHFPGRESAPQISTPEAANSSGL